MLYFCHYYWQYTAVVNWELSLEISPWPMAYFQSLLFLLQPTKYSFCSTGIWNKFCLMLLCCCYYFVIFQTDPDISKYERTDPAPTSHFFGHKSKRTERFHVAQHINTFFLFICIYIYPSGFHLELKTRVLRDHNKGCFPWSF